MQWYNTRTIEESAYYWKCWRDGQGYYSLLGVEYLWPLTIQQLHENEQLMGSLWFYGPLEAPPMPK
jgi:hypothetical protein